MNTGSPQPDNAHGKQSPVWAPPSAPPPGRPRNQLWPILIGVAAVVAAGAFAVVSLQKDDPSTTPATSVAATLPSVSVATTTEPPASTPSPTTTTPATIAQVVDATTLIAAMPSDAEVPAEWSRYAEPFERTDSAGVGLCRGPTEVSRAIQSGATAKVAGPGWELPNDGWFGIEVMFFPTESDASAFLVATVGQASSCSTSPAVWEQSEAEVDFFSGDFANDAMWQLTEMATVSEEAIVNGNEDMRLLQEWRATTTYDVLYSQVQRWIYSYERHGRVVIEFWIGGTWGETGWTSFAGAYQPTDADLDAAAEVVRAGIVARLADAAALQRDG